MEYAANAGVDQRTAALLVATGISSGLQSAGNQTAVYDRQLMTKAQSLVHPFHGPSAAGRSLASKRAAMQQSCLSALHEMGAFY